MVTLREQTEQFEKETLATGAAHSALSRGRSVYNEPCPIRTDFQRDRDRVIHSKSFRRLMHKTQVYLSPEGDHYRTRLTHTLEVSQIARTISRALHLNEDLTEAIALGHDLGHTPFGHAGEFALDDVYPKGFKHNLHSVRVVHFLENNLNGLNLTWEVKNGIACHSGDALAKTLEGRIVKFSDKIAYLNHDIDDSLRAGVLTDEDIPKIAREVLGRTTSGRITTFVNSIIENSDSEDIRMSPEVFAAFETLKSYMFENVYFNPVPKGEESKAKDIVKWLYAYYVKNSHKLEKEYKVIAERSGAERAACDFIAGMSDRYAVALFEKLFIPKSWSVT